MEKDGKVTDAILDYEQAKRFAAYDDWQPKLRAAIAKKSESSYPLHLIYLLLLQEKVVFFTLLPPLSLPLLPLSSLIYLFPSNSPTHFSFDFTKAERPKSTLRPLSRTKRSNSFHFRAQNPIVTNFTGMTWHFHIGHSKIF